MGVCVGFFLSVDVFSLPPLHEEDILRSVRQRGSCLQGTVSSAVGPHAGAHYRRGTFSLPSQNVDFLYFVIHFCTHLYRD